MTSTSLSCGRANAKSTHAKKRERAARPEAPASPLPPEVRLLHHPRTARRLRRAAHPLQPALPPFREEEESRRMAMSSMKVPNSSSKHSPVRPREAKPRIAVAGGTNGKVAVQPAAQEKHTGPREKHIEGRRGAAHGGKRGEKVDVLDKGGAPVRKRWRVRGVAGEVRTGTRLLEDSDRALAGNHPSSKGGGDGVPSSTAPMAQQMSRHRQRTARASMRSGTHPPGTLLEPSNPSSGWPRMSSAYPSMLFTNAFAQR